MDPLAAGLQALSIFKGGAQSPSVTSGGAGTFANQTLMFGDVGLPEWNMNAGGSGMPPMAQAFSGPVVFNTAPRADSLVMGLTGLSTVSNQAVGNGFAVNQTPTATSYTMLALVAAVAFGAAYFLKK